MNQYTMGEKIRKYRLNKGITQDALAAELHVSSQAVSKWENGQNTPDISLLIPLSRLLEVSVNDLLGGDRKHEFEQRLMDAENFNDELALLVVYEALKEFPDDEFFLYQRANYEYKLATRNGAQRGSSLRYISKAIHHSEKLVEKFPDNDNYKSLLAHSYFAIGEKTKALQATCSIDDKETRDHCVESFSNPNEVRLLRQKRIQVLMSQLIFQLGKYNTRESIDVAYTLADAMLGDDRSMRCFYLWRVYLIDALWHLDNGNIDLYNVKLTQAYECVKELDLFGVDDISCRAKIFDGLSISQIQRSQASVKEFLYEFLYQPRLLHPASIDLRCRIVQESINCHVLNKFFWERYYQFCKDFICKGDYFSNYSTGWHITDEEFKQKMDFIASKENAYLYLKENEKNEVEQLISTGQMRGYVASVGDKFFAFCHCGNKESFKQYGFKELSFSDSPSGAKILSIVEILIADLFKGCGLVKKLLSYTLEQAKKNGYTHAEVYPLERMHDDKEYFKELLECYQNAGFTLVIDRSNETDGINYLMRKEL